MADQSSDTQMDEHRIVHIDANRELIRKIISLVGDDPDREGLKDTPKRVLKSYREIFGGYAKDPKEVLGVTFEASDYDQMVICKDIELYSTCEHHMIPFFGKCHIGYIPRERVVGLSKLARLVEIFSRRLQIQENLTDQIKNALVEHLKPKGVMVVIESKHMCMCARGVAKQNSLMITSSIHGVFKEPGVRQEFMGLTK